MLRFSQRVVCTGHTPSSGMALTGRSSPSPAISLAVTFLTNSGAILGTSDAGRGLPVAVAGTLISCRLAIAWSTAS